VIKRIFVLMIFSFQILLLASAESVSVFSLDEYVELKLNNEISSDYLLSILEGMENSLSDDSKTWEKLYFQARVSFYKGQIYWEKENKALSIKTLEDSINYAKKSLEIEESSQTRVLISEALSLLMLQKGMIFTIANFSETQNQAKLALEADDSNPRAKLIIALFLCNAPAIAGGDKKEGEKMLLSLTKVKDLSRIDKFYINKSIAEFYEKEERFIEGIKYCRESLLYYSGNEKSLQLLSRLGGR